MATRPSINITVPSAKDVLCRPESRTISEDGDSGDGTSTKSAGQDVDENAAYNGLTLESVLEPDTGVEGAQDGAFEIDAMHIIGASKKQSVITLSTLAKSLPKESRKRQYRFEFDVAGMLNNDVELTRMHVEFQARQLLRALADCRRSSDQGGHRATMIFAYDIGAVILDKAISIASKEVEGHLGIFMSIARIVFVGCFHRGSEQELGLKLFSFLNDNSVLDEEGAEVGWKPRITLSSVQNLASTARLSTAEFLASKISLRCRIFSLYAGFRPTRIHPSLGYFFATLGLSSELALQEQDSEDMQAAFPGLVENIGEEMKAWSFLGSSQIALELSVLSLAAPEAPVLTKAPSLTHPIIKSDAYSTWRRLNGTQVMHLEDLNPEATREAAEQLSIDWIRRQQFSGNYYPRSFLFRFCACDPQRNSITAMLTSCILHFCRTSSSAVEDQQGLLQDQYKLQNAWTEEDMCNFVLHSYTWMRENSPLVLLGLDECNTRSRKRFWKLVGEIASRTEEPVKIVVTSSKPGSYTAKTLREELKEWSEVNVLEWEMAAEPKIDTEPNSRIHALLARLRPWNVGDNEVRRALGRLHSMNPSTLCTVLDLVERYSRWPAEESKDNLTAFLDAINLVEPSYTPCEAAWAILQSAIGGDLRMNALPWMLVGQRPFTLDELAGLVAFGRGIDDDELRLPEAAEIADCSRELDRKFRGLASLDGDYFRIRSDVLVLLADGFTKGWEECRERAPGLTANVLLQYLRLGGTQKRLHALFQRYEDHLRRSGDGITPPIASNGKDMLLYAVNALPHHLSNIQVPEDVESQMRHPSGPYEAWSKVYWAMSNPFSRTPYGPLKSAWSTWESTPEFGPPSMVRLRGPNRQAEEMKPPMESLGDAVRANNEDMALIFAEEVISDFQDQCSSLKKEHTLTFPPPILWRATWLDMDRLLALLLLHSKQKDDNSATSCPSMLYLACFVGSSKSVGVLISHGADVRVKMDGSSTPLYTACTRGYLSIIQSLLNKDPSLLTWPQPQTPLSRASCWGCWHTVEILLQMGADPEQPEDDAKLMGDGDWPGSIWLPVVIASCYGLQKTARILLEHGADPNTIGHKGMDTCLWYAAIDARNPDTMKELLDHGSDPNHSKLDPPLLIEIIRETELLNDIKLRMFDILLGNDPPVDLDRASEDGRTPLMVAAQVGNESAVHWLLENGASVNAVDSANHTALHLAIVEGKWGVVHQLLHHREKTRLDLVCSHQETPLQTAMGNTDELSKLLDAGGDPRIVNQRQQALLNCAVVAENTAVVKMLLEPGRDVDVHHRDNVGWSPILDATGDVPNSDITRMLMEAGASLADTTSAGYSPLHNAASVSRPDVLRVLLEFHEADDLARTSEMGETALLAVRDLASHNTFECIRLLVRAGTDVNCQDSDGETLLIRSASVGPGARDVHNWLLARPKVNIHLQAKGSGTALHIACKYGDVGLVDMLLQKGADANSKTMYLTSTPLIAACVPDQREDSDESPQSRIDSIERMVRNLVARGADVSLTSGVTLFNALCAAALCAGTGTINFILDKAASTRTPDPLGRLPIHFAAANGIRNFEAVALVHGEDIMIPDNFGKNALHWAAQFGNAETVEAILQRLSPKDRKRYVNGEDVDGWTPLAWASRITARDNGPCWVRSEPQDYEATIQHLVDNGGDIHVRFRMGRGDTAEELTPLRMAKRCEADDAMIELLKSGGDTPSQSGDEPVYVKSTGFCDFCFAQGRGLKHGCETCGLYAYVLCQKCFPSASVEHPRASTFEGDHTLFSPVNGVQEFVAQSTPSVVSESVVSDDKEPSEAGVSHEGRAYESSPDWEATDFREDDIDQLEIPDLNDPGNLEDL